MPDISQERLRWFEHFDEDKKGSLKQEELVRTATPHPFHVARSCGAEHGHAVRTTPAALACARCGRSSRRTAWRPT